MGREVTVQITLALLNSFSPDQILLVAFLVGVTGILGLLAGFRGGIIYERGQRPPPPVYEVKEYDLTPRRPARSSPETISGNREIRTSGRPEASPLGDATEVTDDGLRAARRATTQEL